MNKNMVNRMMFVSVILTIASLTKSIQPPTPLIKRPELVRNALKNNQPIHYFGLGSNMSRKKIENRGLNGTSIEILNMEAAVVPNYRLGELLSVCYSPSFWQLAIFIFPKTVLTISVPALSLQHEGIPSPGTGDGISGAGRNR